MLLYIHDKISKQERKFIYLSQKLLLKFLPTCILPSITPTVAGRAAFSLIMFSTSIAVLQKKQLLKVLIKREVNINH